MKKLVITALMLTCIHINAMDVENEEWKKEMDLVGGIYEAGDVYRFIAFNSDDFEYLDTSDNSKPPLSSWLIQASIEGNLDRVKELCNKDADVNTISIFGWSPLHEAALRNHTEIIRFLLAKGANPNSTYQECLKKIPHDANFHLMSHLHHNTYKSAQLELSGGRKYDNNNTPLHLAVRSGNTETVKLLVEAGADHLAKNNDNKTPVDLASDEKTMNYFRYLFSKRRCLQQAIKNLEKEIKLIKRGCY